MSQHPKQQQQQQQLPQPAEPEPEPKQQEQEQEQEQQLEQLLTSYIGISFALFIATLPLNSLTLIATFESKIATLTSLLHNAEDQLKQMSSRRKEDSKANARVVEIFASHRNAWQAEERRLLRQIDAAGVEAASLRAKVEELERERDGLEVRVRDLEREVGERDEMIGFFSRSVAGNGDGDGDGDGDRDEEESELGRFGVGVSSSFEHEDERSVGFGSDLFASASSRFWAGRGGLWQVI